MDGCWSYSLAARPFLAHLWTFFFFFFFTLLEPHIAGIHRAASRAANSGSRSLPAVLEGVTRRSWWEERSNRRLTDDLLSHQRC
jgi:hypothetical protein